jgi:hypothetical protein
MQQRRPRAALFFGVVRCADCGCRLARSAGAQIRIWKKR